ncbi:MAG: peptidase [Clostridia bacterium]|jgi:hypothetical protein|uniref:zinc metallopeptidase n=1 Tax=Petroclostridium xylanilyticum TaxID=1792311 RepID=UPI000B982AE9|nr:zinc metallopeptidase [Petroclostridium xylanilyticum]MBZ4646164.1 peptidase [Clostridia bacterium]
MFYIDPYYIMLVLPAFLFALYTQFKVSSTFSKYSNYGNIRGLTGAEVAREILYSNGLYDVAVEPVAGQLTDHYDPKTKVVRLSESVYYSRSVAAIGVAAHETGHAIQHQIGYAPLALRSGLVPIAGIGSTVGPYLAMLGLIFNWSFMLQLGIILFTGAVAFYLITLPVEFNASRRAVNILQSRGLLTWNEIEPVKKVLRAAAMTYVASAAVAMANLARLILLAGARDDRD